MIVYYTGVGDFTECLEIVFDITFSLNMHITVKAKTFRFNHGLCLE